MLSNVIRIFDQYDSFSEGGFFSLFRSCRTALFLAFTVRAVCVALCIFFWGHVGGSRLGGLLKALPPFPTMLFPIGPRRAGVGPSLVEDGDLERGAKFVVVKVERSRGR